MAITVDHVGDAVCVLSHGAQTPAVTAKPDAHVRSSDGGKQSRCASGVPHLSMDVVPGAAAPQGRSGSANLLGGSFLDSWCPIGSLGATLQGGGRFVCPLHTIERAGATSARFTTPEQLQAPLRIRC
jgi:hypothetical protein